jgi:predicted AAA+ superfamily ATPase
MVAIVSSKFKAISPVVKKKGTFLIETNKKHLKTLEELK